MRVERLYFLTFWYLPGLLSPKRESKMLKTGDSDEGYRNLPVVLLNEEMS